MLDPNYGEENDFFIKFYYNISDSNLYVIITLRYYYFTTIILLQKYGQSQK